MAPTKTTAWEIRKESSYDEVGQPLDPPTRAFQRDPLFQWLDQDIWPAASTRPVSREPDHVLLVSDELRRWRRDRVQFVPVDVQEGADDIGLPEELVDSALRLLQRIDPEQLRQMIDDMEAAIAGDDEFADLLGSVPSPRDVFRAYVWNMETERTRKAAAIRDSLHLHEVARHLGLAPDVIRKHVEKGKLSAIGDGSHLPRWQFDSEGEPFPGIDRLLATFPGRPSALAMWVHEHHPDLGATPRDALAAGRLDDVVHAAARGLATA